MPISAILSLEKLSVSSVNKILLYECSLRPLLAIFLRAVFTQSIFPVQSGSHTHLSRLGLI